MNKIKLPRKLQNIIGERILIQNHAGCSKSEIYLIKDIFKNKNAYLKISGDAGGPDLELEKRALEWLGRKIPVPEIFFYSFDNDRQYLLISEVEGTNLADAVSTVEAGKLVSIMAKGLLKIHSIDISNCPFDQTLDAKLKAARKRMDSGFVDEDDFEETHRGTPIAVLFEDLIKNRPPKEDAVFTHGDYCLPNIIMNEGKLSGFIDLERAGISDRWQDLALAARSIMHNSGDERLVKIFFDEYGITDIDRKKIDYYILLDEFF